MRRYRIAETATQEGPPRFHVQRRHPFGYWCRWSRGYLTIEEAQRYIYCCEYNRNPKIHNVTVMYEGQEEG